MNKAIYPGTFDPFTNGHEDIVKRASKMFGHITIAVAANSTVKRHLFDANERVDMIKEVLGKRYPNVSVEFFSGLLINYMRDNSFGILLRGLRAVADFEYEFQLAYMNRKLEQNHETIFLIPSEENLFVSSTMIREISAMNGSVGQFVHPIIEARLREKYKKM